MLTKILAASVLTVGLATAAMAQSAGGSGGTNSGGGSGQTVTIDPKTPATSPDQAAPDTSITTGSTTGGDMNSNADKNCPNGPQSAQGDANSTNAGNIGPTVNDKNCGK
jgi:hypothetical protein